MKYRYSNYHIIAALLSFLYDLDKKYLMFESASRVYVWL